MKSFLTAVVCAAALAAASLSLGQSAGDSNMLGRQSQNSGLQAVPVKGPVVIDGKLDDWDLTGRIWSFADIGLRDQFSVETSAMWDADALYLALQWHDPTPMFNQVDPKTNPGDGWRSDSVQMRILTDETSWLTAWHHTAGNTSNIHLVHLKQPNNEKDVITQFFFGKPGESDLGNGLKMAFQKTGSDSYTQEIRIPWELVYKQKPTAFKPGDKIQIGFEFLWGDPSGKTFPNFRYADNMQPGITSREFFWRARQAWGDVQLMPNGGLPLRQYRAPGITLEGPIKFDLDLPKQAKRFTAVIEDSAGHRVRNLIADYSPEDFAASDSSSGQKLNLAWDGKNDDGGIVPAGAYHVRGLWHEGLDATYDTTFYNPGTPPWQTADGTGAWGSNHTLPEFVAAAGDWMAVGWKMSEGGSAIVGVNPEGLKKWGEQRGAFPLAADKDYVYSCVLQEGTLTPGAPTLIRLGARDGKYAPYAIDGKERTFPLPVAEIFPGKTVNKVTALAAHDGKVAISLDNGSLAILDGKSAQPLSDWPVASKVTSLAYSDAGDLYAVSDAAVVKVGVDGKLTPFATPGLGKAGALTVDHSGNVLVFDLGADQQVKAFSPQGKVAYTVGKKGGRAMRGVFDEQGMIEVTCIAVDATGKVWATEHTNYPRRVSVWGKDGKLDHDYTGTTGYAGVGCYLYENDPTLAYVGPVELKVDRAHDTWKVTRVLWKADESRADEPKTFNMNPQENSSPSRFRSAAGGVMREFLYKQPTYYFAEPTVLFMEDDKGWRPVSALGLAAQFSGKIGPKGQSIIEEPSGEFAGVGAWDGCIWNDLNGDGRVQRNECEIVPAAAIKKGTRPPSPIPLGNGWNCGVNPTDLSILTQGISRYKPLRFTKEGAPVYGMSGIVKVTPKDQAGLAGYDIPSENLVIGMRSGGVGAAAMSPVPGLTAIDKNGNFIWTYPNLYPGVHGSHNAPMPHPGLLVGPLKVMGAAKVNDVVGNVFVMRGNLGQDFFFTTDGLYAGALFKDCRFPNHELPDTVAEIKGTSMANYSEGGEPFSGWFGKQADGKFRITTSMARTACLVVEVKGLDTINRFKGPELHVSDADIVKIAAMPPPPPAAGQKPAPYHIEKVASPLPVDGGAKEWGQVPAVAIAREGSPEKATAQLAHDDKTLFVRFDVTDGSPLANGGNDFKRLFKTGDAVDIQLGTSGAADRKEPIARDSRVLLTVMQGQPVAVLMVPKDSKAGKSDGETYTSPVGPKHFDRVEKMAGVPCAAKRTDTGYTITAAIPFASLGIDPTPGMKLRGDLGFISSDARGITNMARTYWSNQATGLVNDEPQEAWLFPATWSELILE